jgi:tetratricopeptide (TPR) repeat protein
MRAGAAMGQALLAQGKADEALAAFERVIGTAAEGEQAQRQRMIARVGKAAALVALKKPDEAVKLVGEVLEQTDPEANPADVPLVARAYNVLGAAQRQAGRTKEAILAYLRVELLYSSQPAAHAEALANLAELWEQVHKSDRAARARQNLKEQYPDSPWTKKGGG